MGHKSSKSNIGVQNVPPNWGPNNFQGFPGQTVTGISGQLLPVPPQMPQWTPRPSVVPVPAAQPFAPVTPFPFAPPSWAGFARR